MRKIIDKLSILKSAVVEFSKNGFYKASTNNIAKLSRVSKGSIFKYFKSKKNLFKQVMNYSVEIFKNEVSNFEIKSNIPNEIIYEAINFLRTFYKKYPDIYQFYLKSVYFLDIPSRENIKEVVKIFSGSITLKILNKLREINFIDISDQFDEEILVNYLNSIISRIVETDFFEVNDIFESRKAFDKLIFFILNGIKKKQ
ncbi:MAG: TetR/AcrR family transcriptional regulator [Spirochaetes bacterium]|nr:TetR/AcrR family transcriptional regulator [Spirochaetota bacterium]